MSSGAVAMKLDMAKAFDRMEWTFVLTIMQKMGFSEKWCQLINQCISTSSISIILTGSPTASFVPSKGLHQGDALSPYIFILCMEAFSRMLQKAEDTGLIKPLQPAARGPKVSHLFFADDCLLFSNASPIYVSNLMRIVNDFCAVSGQMVNLQKSSIHFSKNLDETAKQSIMHLVRMKCMPLNEKYLGINLFIGRNKNDYFDETTNKMDFRLQSWQGKLINQAGRSTQIQAVVGTMDNFQLGCLKIPYKSIKKLEPLQRNYWWNKPSSKGCKIIGWSEVSKPKRMGDLGFKNIKLFNEALLTKLAWRMLHEKDAKWVQMLQARYFQNSDPLYGRIKKKGTWNWQGIQQGLSWIRKFHVWEVGDGSTIEVGKGHWFGDYSQDVTLQNLSMQATNFKVSDFIDHPNRSWRQDTLSQLFTSTQISQIMDIRIPPQPDVDKLRWSLTTSGNFSVNSTYNAIIKLHSSQVVTRQQEQMWLLIWHLYIPFKCQMFIWKITRNILPVAARFQRIAWVSNPNCVMCDNATETVEHFLLHCPFARAFWFGVALSIFQDANAYRSISEWILSWVEKDHLVCSKRKELINLAVITMWHIWKTRCVKVFDGKNLHPRSVIKQIFTFSHQNNICINTGYNRDRQESRDLTPQHWSYPPLNWIKMNIDVSMLPNTNFVGLSFVLRNHTGSLLEAMAITLRARDIFQAEAIAVLQATRWIAERNFSKIILEGDNKIIIEALNSGKLEGVKWEDHSMLLECLSLINKLHDFQVQFHPRRGNRVADALAKYARNNQVNGYWVTEPPKVINHLTLKDKDDCII
ncbi:uncharacterized protein LOC113294610 [Papaver somniferum]|uniref:uncharacterized protein LOC113294610 n=1 Tax=Papaver somniferum TaxID=3469 RepID=UPI000E703A96|nr:uncharacterized protein LOC113294610 [Papaver somniferum]